MRANAAAAGRAGEACWVGERRRATGFRCAYAPPPPPPPPPFGVAGTARAAARRAAAAACLRTAGPRVRPVTGRGISVPPMGTGAARGHLVRRPRRPVDSTTPELPRDERSEGCKGREERPLLSASFELRDAAASSCAALLELLKACMSGGTIEYSPNGSPDSKSAAPSQICEKMQLPAPPALSVWSPAVRRGSVAAPLLLAGSRSARPPLSLRRRDVAALAARCTPGAGDADEVDLLDDVWWLIDMHDGAPPPEGAMPANGSSLPRRVSSRAPPPPPAPASLPGLAGVRAIDPDLVARRLVRLAPAACGRAWWPT